MTINKKPTGAKYLVMLLGIFQPNFLEISNRESNINIRPNKDKYMQTFMACSILTNI